MLAISQAAELRQEWMTRAEAAQGGVTVPEVRIAATLAEVEGLREVWQGFTVSDIDSDIDYYLSVVAHHERILSPFVVHIRRPAKSDLLVVARLERLPLAFRVGYKRFFQTETRALVLSFGGVLGAESHEDEELAMRELGHLLQKGVADILVMRNLDATSSLCAATLASAPKRQVHTGAVSQRWLARIPDTFDAFLDMRSGRSQSTLRRQEKQLRKRYGEGLALRRLDAPEHFGELVRDMEAVAEHSYQRRLGVGFTDTPMQRALIATGLRQGWYATWMLHLNGMPVSFWSGFRYGNTFYIGTPAYHPAYAKDSVGMFTMLQMVKDLCADPAIQRLDFGQGEADYKSAFGEPVRAERDVMIAAPRFWPMALLAVYFLVLRFNVQAKRLAEQSAFLKRFKRRWRRAGAGA